MNKMLLLNSSQDLMKIQQSQKNLQGVPLKSVQAKYSTKSIEDKEEKSMTFKPMTRTPVSVQSLDVKIQPKIIMRQMVFNQDKFSS